MLVGNPHIVKGAKLWEWGKGSYWDTHVLTDTDGPYAEVMSGAYSDNQPDYSWIKPYEYKVFKQYWYPMRESKGALSANLHGLLNVEVISEEEVSLFANTTAPYKDAKILLRKGDEPMYEETLDISPANPYRKRMPLPGVGTGEELILELYDSKENLLVSYFPQKKEAESPLPEPVKPPLAPSRH